MAKQFQEQLQPLVEWLGVTERKVKALELVPTDEEKIQQKIREHKVNFWYIIQELYPNTQNDQKFLIFFPVKFLRHQLKNCPQISIIFRQVLHDDIIAKQPPFKQLTETASQLMGLVGDDEAAALADRLQAATDR